MPYSTDEINLAIDNFYKEDPNNERILMWQGDPVYEALYDQMEGKSFEDNGYIIVADLPKRVRWNQQRLKELVDLIQSGWGENPADYVKVRYEVSERAYEAWPPRLKELFTPARTVETGKPAYELIPPKTF